MFVLAFDYLAHVLLVIMDAQMLPKTFLNMQPLTSGMQDQLVSDSNYFCDSNEMFSKTGNPHHLNFCSQSS